MDFTEDLRFRILTSLQVYTRLRGLKLAMHGDGSDGLEALSYAALATSASSLTRSVTKALASPKSMRVLSI